MLGTFGSNIIFSLTYSYQVSLNGLYLYSNGQAITIYIGPNCSGDLLEEGFGVRDIREVAGISTEYPL